MPTQEEKLLDKMFGRITEEEARYLKWLLPRVSSGAVTVERGRELFKEKFPNTEWMK